MIVILNNYFYNDITEHVIDNSR